MKVLLINAGTKYVKQKAPIPLGLLSIATFLKKNGHTALIYDRSVEGGNIRKYLDCFSPDMVGISVPGGMSFDDALKLSKTAKQNNIPVVWGGPMSSLIPELVLKSGVVNYVVMGDGEITLLALINAIIGKTPLKEVDGLAFVENGEPTINKERELADLSQLPAIDFSFVNPTRYFFKNRSCQRMLHVYASKGCTGVCAYCYNSGYSKGKWRARPPEHHISELRYLVDNYKIDGVYFVDDLLSPNNEYLINFCNKLIESDLNIFWSCDMRADLCTKEGLQLMYDAGNRWIMFGIESGTAQGQKFIKKDLDLEQAKKIMDYCDEIGIFTTTTFITGLPDQTEEDLKETIRYMQELNSKVKIAGIFGPFPKAEMYYDLVRQKRISVPQSLKEWGEIATMHTLGNNLSKVPSIELQVIVNYFLFSIFTNKYKLDDSDKRLWVRRLAFQISDMLKRGNLRSIFLVILSAKEFFEIVFYATMFPQIRKKYGLYKTKKKN